MKQPKSKAEQYIMECVENYKREDIPYTQAIVAIALAKKEFEEQHRSSMELLEARLGGYNRKAIRAYCACCKSDDIGKDIDCTQTDINCPFVQRFVTKLNKE